MTQMAQMDMTAAARIRFLEHPDSTESVKALGVREEIVSSWRRSVLHGLTPAQALPRRVGPVEQDTQLMRAARQVLDSRRHLLATLTGGVTLTDWDGRLLAVWVEDARFARRLDARGVVPGMSISESAIGTNSGGICLETGQPVIVVGHEHFSDGAVSMTSVGAPIRNLITHRIIGSLNFTCAAKDTHALMLPWIAELTSCIEREIIADSSRRHQALFDAYLTTTKDVRHPVVCVGEHTVIANRAAARILDATDHALLAEIAADPDHSHERHSEIALSTGVVVEVEAKPVMVADRNCGTVLRLTKLPNRQSRRSSSGAQPAKGNLGRLGLLPGRSARAIRFLTDSANAFASSQAVLLLGEPGTGKSTVGACLVSDDPGAVTIDADAVGSQSVASIKELAAVEGQTILARRIDRLDDVSLAAVTVTLSSGLAVGVRLVATADTRVGARAIDRLLDWPGVVVTAPALRSRLEDIPQLVAAMTKQALNGVDGPKWSAEAIRVLCRAPWTSNLTSLQRVVANVVVGMTRPIIEIRDLPPDLLALTPRRQLAGLEEIEAHAIFSALEASAGNKREAAEALGIARSTLYRKVRALGIEVS